jgi:hypothetical protein
VIPWLDFSAGLTILRFKDTVAGSRAGLVLAQKVTVHSILGNDQLDALFLIVFILCLYMIRAASAHHQEGQIVSIHHLV